MGVLFGNYHSKEKYGLDLLSYKISSPKEKTNTVSVPLRDGVIDLTHCLTDEIKYENRGIEILFEVRDKRELWPSVLSTIKNELHGRTMKVIFDDDAAYYYYGRVSVGEFTSNGSTGSLKITVDAEPFKYDVLSSAVDWEWDIFDFETGIINDTGELIVNGSTTITLICRQKRMFPTFTASADMTVTYDGETYNLKAGSQKVYDIFFVEGENELTFTGNGTVTIDYVGGSL